MRSCTAVVATYDRRHALERLLGGLASQLRDDPELADGFDVVVVVDGSTDDTVAMLEALEYPVPLKIEWQHNRGRAAARNVGLSLAQGEFVWFLDDDLIPEPGLVRRHRASHDDRPLHLLMGPYPLVEGSVSPAPNEQWTASIYDEMARAGRVISADQFASGNASGPADVFRSVGGFDEGFTGWGCEDVELGYRILSAGYDIDFDPSARAVHEQSVTIEQYVADNISNGRNMVRAIRMHPALVDDLLPVDAALESRRRWRARAASLYRIAPVRSPLAFRLVASSAAAMVPFEAKVTRGRTRLALYVAMVAATLAGIAEADPSGDLVARKFGIVR